MGKCFFYYKISKKAFNKVLYNIKITIFVLEIKSESLYGTDDFKHV
jgi:hypothetical protein